MIQTAFRGAQRTHRMGLLDSCFDDDWFHSELGLMP
jgi:hypothetical protein